MTLTVREMLDAMGRVAGKETLARVRFVDDERIQGIVKTWPVRFTTERALEMGFKPDATFDEVVRDFQATLSTS
jgi:nucleoside-diphosphate-sugar epimerase